jgi:hypothetical protein
MDGTGFEPSVPAEGAAVLAMSALVRAVFPLAGNQAEATSAVEIGALERDGVI